MNRTAALALSFSLVVATTASAQLPPPGQTVAPDLTFDRATLPLDLHLGTVAPEELDGDSTTTEFLQFLPDAFGATWIRGFAIRDGAWCVGPWMLPTAYVELLPGDRTASVTIDKIDGRAKLVVIGDRRMFRTVPIPYGCE